jgi:D-alanyl-D-alanine carboxypeptidase
MIPKRATDFLFSFGLMMLGVGLLFAFTVSFTPSPKQCQYKFFPKSHPRLAIGGDAEQKLPPSRPTVPLAKDNSVYTATFTAFSAYAIDEKTGTVLYEKNSDEVRPLASISKIMSAIILMDLPMDWSSTTTVLETDCDSSSHHLIAGEIFTLDDLWSAGLVGSSNSAIRALVRVSGLSNEEFLNKMNAKAKAMGFKTFYFTDPTGLDAGSVGSAREVAGLLRETLRFEKISQTMKIGELYIQPVNKSKPRRVWSTNWLLTKWIPSDFDQNSICGKTGFIGDARYNFAVRVGDKDGHNIIVAVLGSVSNEARFTEARDIADWVFDEYVWPDEAPYDTLSE